MLLSAPLMEGFVDAASVDDVPLNRAKSLKLGERTIALYHTPRGYFASNDRCPHRGGPLGEGDIIGDEIVCPWHFWSFDVRTGLCPGNSEISIVMHEVKVHGQRIFVKLAPARPNTELS